MSIFDHKASSDGASGDPLDRLVEAFVDQSVPVGPETAVNRQLVAAMYAASAAGASPAEGSAAGESLMPAPRPVGEGDDVRRHRRGRAWLRIAVQQALALAAAIAIVLTTALLWRTPGEHNQAAAPPVSANDLANDDSTESAPSGIDELDAADSREFARLLDALDAYIESPHNAGSDRRALEKMLASILRENPELARSEAWRRAQERLTIALEKPQMLGMGVSILGTLSWTTYGRF